MSSPRVAAVPLAERAEIGEVTRLLKGAAYFPIFNVHNSALPNDTVPLLPFAVQTLGQALFTAVNVNEELRRFEVVTQVEPAGLTSLNRISSNGVANVSIRWTPIPDGYAPSPGISPPPTLLNPFTSQRFTMLNGQLSFQDRNVSGVRAFGSGRTFPISGRTGSLNIGAVIDILEGSGALYGLSDETLPGATMVINGFITPPNDLALNLIVRVMDPDGRLAAGTPIPPMVLAEATPSGSGTFMFFLGEADPRRPIRLLYGPGGLPIGAQVFENLRLVRTGFDPDSLQCSTQEGPIVGTASARLNFSFANEFTVTQAWTTGSIFSFHDLQGRSLGSLSADLVEGRAFRTFLPGAPYPVFRLGGFGPFLSGTGTFAGAQGMMTLNGAIGVFPPALSNLYVLRFEDPDRRLQVQLQGAGFPEAQS
ncbi:MAG: hypothetical protein WAM82_32925 [Thermoanaerobaculia bacterium]